MDSPSVQDLKPHAEAARLVLHTLHARIAIDDVILTTEEDGMFYAGFGDREHVRDRLVDAGYFDRESPPYNALSKRAPDGIIWCVAVIGPGVVLFIRPRKCDCGEPVKRAKEDLN
jgi:hypothetical protein